MNLDRLCALLAPALVCLFLVLSVFTLAVQTTASTGVYLPITRVRTISFNDCFDDRDIFVRLKKDGSTWINETLERPGKLGPTIAEIMQAGRTQRVVYVLTDPDVSFERFLSSYNEISTSASDLHVGVITTDIDRELRKCPPGSICGLDWPDHGYLHSCLVYEIQPIYILKSPAR